MQHVELRDLRSSVSYGRTSCTDATQAVLNPCIPPAKDIVGNALIASGLLPVIAHAHPQLLASIQRRDVAVLKLANKAAGRNFRAGIPRPDRRQHQNESQRAVN